MQEMMILANVVDRPEKRINQIAAKLVLTSNIKFSCYLSRYGHQDTYG